MLIALATLAAYSNSFRGAFVFDDRIQFEDSPNIRSLSPIWRAAWADPNTPAGGRPLVSLSLAVNYAVSGDSTWSYHVFNVVVHVCAGLTLLGVLRRTLARPALAGALGDSADTLAWAAALIWSVHPLQTESVTYITTRTESMAGLFYLLTVYASIRSLDSARGGRWQVVAVAACLLGVLSKENAASAPLFVALYDRVLVFPNWRMAWRARSRLYIGLAICWLVLGALLVTGSFLRLARAGTSEVTAVTYALTQLGVIMHYLRLSFWPDPLVVDYFDWPIARSLVAVWPQALAVAVLLGATLWALHRKLAAGLAGAWFFLILAPSSSIVPLSTEIVAERRMYLPLAAVVTLVLVGVFRVLSRYSRAFAECVVVGGAVAAAGVLGVCTHRQNRVYASEITFWQDQVEKRPGNARALSALGRSYQVAGRPETAVRHFDKCLEIRPDYGLAWYGRGLALRDSGDARGSLESLRRAAALEPSRPPFRYALGVALLKAADTAGAEHELREALRLRPTMPGAHFHLGLLAAQTGRLADAAAHFDAELRVAPTDSNALANLSAVLVALGRADDAIARLDAALRHRPGDPVLIDARARAISAGR